MRRWAVLLTAETGARRLLGPWRSPERPLELADRLLDELAAIEVDDDGGNGSTLADRVGVDVVELEPWHGIRDAVAWAGSR